MTKSSLALSLIFLAAAACNQSAGGGKSDAANGPGDGATDTTAGTATGTDTSGANGTDTGTGTGTGSGTGTTTDTTNVGDVNLITDPTFNQQLAPDQIIAKMDDTMSSLADTNVGTVMMDTSLSLTTYDPFSVCGADGRPKPGEGVYGNPRYVGKLFFCAFGYDGTPFTARGSFGLLRGILCGLKKADKLHVDGQSYTAELAGDDCFPSAMATTIAGSPRGALKTTVTATALTGGEWTTKLALIVDMSTDLAPAPQSMEVQLRSSDTAIGFKLKREGANTPDWSGIAATLKKDGTLLFERRSDEGGSKTGSTVQTFRHQRLLISGKLADAQTASFESVDKFEGIMSEPNRTTIGPQFGRNADVFTIQGAAATGYRTRAYRIDPSCNTPGCADWANATWLPGLVECLRDDPAKTCGAGITFDFAGNFAGEAPFLMLPESGYTSGYKAPLAWYDALSAPLAFTAVTKAD